jgi:hypothetical protein
MSALPPEADIRQRIEHVCFVPEADIRPSQAIGVANHRRNDMADRKLRQYDAYGVTLSSCSWTMRMHRPRCLLTAEQAPEKAAASLRWLEGLGIVARPK